MKYVYLVYEECHGLVGVYGHEAIAIARIHELAKDADVWDGEKYSMFDTDTPYDYLSDDRVGWEGVAWYCREEVIQ